MEQAGSIASGQSNQVGAEGDECGRQIGASLQTLEVGIQAGLDGVGIGCLGRGFVLVGGGRLWQGSVEDVGDVQDPSVSFSQPDVIILKVRESLADGVSEAGQTWLVGEG